MTAPENSIEPQASDAPLPNSRKVYVAGQLHPDIRIPFREISLAPTKTMSGEIEVNEPVRVYDTSGPWGDPDSPCDVREGLPQPRREWILARGDVKRRPMSLASFEGSVRAVTSLQLAHGRPILSRATDVAK